ncbi:hypothetical protein NDU88_005314 [Pleurodeles waltl]|uniref:Uncharacterized protein n=1 Tax=Pleurodeles waltl TaxID=8319 RepID=A0AAV7L0E2_PLEWA|nr:hypothetical protein NDU88_005314 [Pleurodeles waltl]
MRILAKAFLSSTSTYNLFVKLHAQTANVGLISLSIETEKLGESTGACTSKRRMGDAKTKKIKRRTRERKKTLDEEREKAKRWNGRMQERMEESRQREWLQKFRIKELLHDGGEPDSN